MKIYELEKHTTCFCYDKKEKPLVDIVVIEQDKKSSETLSNNVIIFALEGALSISLRIHPSGMLYKGDLAFLPAGDSLQYKAINKSELLVLRLIDSVSLCYNFSFEQLYSDLKVKVTPLSFFPLKANPRIGHFAKGLAEAWRDGLRCRNFLRSEISKLLTMLPIYYSKNELYNFYFPVLSPDAAFSEYVRTHHLQHRTINELAAAMHLTSQQFTRRFNAIFGQNPHEWLQREKARLIYGEICQTYKPLKEIAAEYGFTDQANFNRFCKTFYETTPGEIRQNRK